MGCCEQEHQALIRDLLAEHALMKKFRQERCFVDPDVEHEFLQRWAEEEAAAAEADATLADTPIILACD